MSDKKQKLTPEQIEQIKQLQMLMQNQKNPNEIMGKPKKTPFTLKGLFIGILQYMQHGVKFIDQFTDFIIKKDSSKANDVIKSARSPILFGTFVVVFMALFGLVWAGTAPLDSASVALGKVISNSQKKEINHPEGGIIKKIYVKVGDEVKKDDPLIEIDDTKIRSDYESTLNLYRTFLAAETRLLAEINGEKELNYPDFLLSNRSLPEVAKIIETQNNLFQSKSDLARSEHDALKQKIEQSKKQIEGYNARKISTEKSLELIRDRLDATKKLYQQNFANKANLLELERNEAQLQGDIAQVEAEIAKTQQEITKTEIELISLDSKISTQALSELRETQTNLSTNRERFFALQESLKRIIIKSPVDGTVNNINYHTIGSSIIPNQTIAEISPKDDRLVIEAKVEPRHIDSISVGLTANIRFSAFKSRTTPSFIGKVVSLSPDIIIDQQTRNPASPTADGYYLARIEIDMEYFDKIAKPRKLSLHPGMQAEVQIVTGTRTLLRYILDPIIDAMFKGLKEK